MPFCCNFVITGVTSSSDKTRSPITIASLPIFLNATHPPSASAGFSSTPFTVTCMSPRGRLNLYTSPGCKAPLRPIASSTAFQSAAPVSAEAFAAGCDVVPEQAAKIVNAIKIAIVVRLGSRLAHRSSRLIVFLLSSSHGQNQSNFVSVFLNQLFDHGIIHNHARYRLSVLLFFRRVDLMRLLINCKAVNFLLNRKILMLAEMIWIISLKNRNLS